MRYKHFYSPANQALRENEEEAWRLWASTFRRGATAVQAKRFIAAEIYLGAAYEIALLRTECDSNLIFEAAHVIQPAELLTDLFLVQGKLPAARSFINETIDTLERKNVKLTAAHQRTMNEVLQRLTRTQRDKALAQQRENEVKDLLPSNMQASDDITQLSNLRKVSAPTSAGTTWRAAQ